MQIGFSTGVSSVLLVALWYSHPPAAAVAPVITAVTAMDVELQYGFCVIFLEKKKAEQQIWSEKASTRARSDEALQETADWYRERQSSAHHSWRQPKTRSLMLLLGEVAKMQAPGSHHLAATCSSLMVDSQPNAVK